VGHCLALRHEFIAIATHPYLQPASSLAAAWDCGSLTASPQLQTFIGKPGYFEKLRAIATTEN